MLPNCIVPWNFLISFTVNCFLLFNLGLLAFTESQKCSRPTVLYLAVTIFAANPTNETPY